MFSYDTGKGVMRIYGTIGPAEWGMVDDTLVAEALAAMDGKDIDVRLNTPGGSVDVGVSIFNLLREYDGKVTTTVDSLAASMGSYLLQAGEVRRVQDNGMVMVHNPWSLAIGNAAAMRKEADILDKYAERMLPAYMERTGRTKDDMQAILDAETWLVGTEAIDEGFADELLPEKSKAGGKMTAAMLARVCKRELPEKIAALLQDNEDGRLEDALLSAGIDRKHMTVEYARKKIAHALAQLDNQ